MDKWDKMGAFSYIMASPDNSNTPTTYTCNILYIRSKQTLECSLDINDRSIYQPSDS